MVNSIDFWSRIKEVNDFLRDQKVNILRKELDDTEYERIFSLLNKKNIVKW